MRATGRWYCLCFYFHALQRKIWAHLDLHVKTFRLDHEAATKKIIDVPLIFSCPADHEVVPDWQPRSLLLSIGGLSLFDESFPNEDATSASRSLQEGSTKPPWGWVKPSRRLHEGFSVSSRSLQCSRRLHERFVKTSRALKASRRDREAFVNRVRSPILLVVT